ncbi:MAG: hemin ABC transporter substrate-binding protein [Spirochaetaceae bacterium]|nr:hemin ABC transporter substrate-binding protein [Spirochaetaceae bacterium]|tara:strand:+ start:12071 stop:12919 length:849 start_codon:yes stop_codon:yes gene_type:complete
MLQKSWHPSLAVALVSLFLASGAARGESPKRIVSLNGSMTEILFAIGAGDQVVGVDTSSVHPAPARQLPKVGYQRSLSAEGVLSLKPDLIIGTGEAGPPPVLQQLRSSGVELVLFEDRWSPDSTYAKILFAGKHSGHEKEARALVAQMRESIATLTKPAREWRVLFIYARGPGMVQVSGKGTQAHSMIALAGAKNAVTSFEGFRPLTSEALVAANPEVILIPTRALESLGGENGLLRIPGVALTEAGKKRRIVAMDDLLLLGFSSRLHIALKELVSHLKEQK